MAEDDALLAAVVASPDDDGPRHAYARWLTQRGDPRGEFIELQLSDLGRPEDAEVHKDAEMLRRKHGAAWVPAIPGLQVKVFRRGFPEFLLIPAESFAAHSAELFRQVPALELKLSQPEPALTRIAALPELSRLRRISLDNGVSESSFIAFVGSPHLTQLSSLEVSSGTIGVRGIRALDASPCASTLTRLSLITHPLENAGAIALAESKRLHFTSLVLLRAKLGEDGIRALAHSPVLDQPFELVLAENEIGAGAAALAESPRLTRLERLNLSQCALKDSTAIAFAQSSTLNRLVELNLSQNAIHDSAAMAFAQSSALRSLVTLNLSDNAITFVAAEALAHHTGLPELKTLGLSRNPIYVPGETENWTDWDGTVVGSGPVQADLGALCRRYGPELRII